MVSDAQEAHSSRFFIFTYIYIYIYIVGVLLCYLFSHTVGVNGP